MICRVNGIGYQVTVHGSAAESKTDKPNGVKPDPDKPALLLLHGFMGSGRNFDHLIEPLGRFCLPVTVDLQGHGNTEGTADPQRYRTERQVSDLHGIMQELEFPHWLYGYSMGGRLALQYALAHGDRLRGLILESTHPGLEQETDRQERWELDEQRARAIETDFPGFLEEWRQNPLFGDRPTDELHKRYRKVQQAQQPEWMAASLRGFGTGTMPAARPHLESLTLPVMLLSGEKDKKYVDLSRQMAQRLPDVRHETVSGASHRVHLDRPDILVSHMQSFITKPNHHES